jgi:hypothetical protein
MKYVCLTIAFLTISTAIFGLGFGDWQETTHNGTVINNFNQHSLRLKDGLSLDFVGKWYFYKDCVVGKRMGENTLGYFVADEISQQIHTFRTEPEWKAFLEKNQLQPQFIRWYNDDWIFFDEGLIIYFVFGFFISIPLTILFLWLLYEAIFQENLNFTKPYTVSVFSILLLIFISWLLERLPQSF